jgi:hypothetical protein
MVKNTKGGSGHKSQAHKNFSNAASKSKTRISEDVDELYAQVTAVLGGSNCHVLGQDNRPRLCHIRGKFRGKGKRDNTLIKGTWVLVGLRTSIETYNPESKKLENCDLLEVYNDRDKKYLMSEINLPCWELFIDNDDKNNHIVSGSTQIVYSNDTDTEYNDLMDSMVQRTPNDIIDVISGGGEEINIEDI